MKNTNFLKYLFIARLVKLTGWSHYLSTTKNPLLSPSPRGGGWAYLFQAHWREDINRDRGAFEGGD